MTKTISVGLNSIETAKRFAVINTESACDVTLTSGKYAVDGQSILGIFGLDLTKPIDVTVEGEEEDIEKLMKGYKDIKLI